MVNTIIMTLTRYTHPSFKNGEYVRLFADDLEQGLIFDKDDYLIGIWCMKP